jgi:hypothetical protein
MIGYVRPFHLLSVGFMSKITELTSVKFDAATLQFILLPCNSTDKLTELQCKINGDFILSFAVIIAIKCHKGMPTVREQTEGAGADRGCSNQ